MPPSAITIQYFVSPPSCVMTCWIRAASDAAAVLADVITTALAADVYALARGNATIDQGVAAAVRKLLPANFVAAMGTRSHPLGLALDPPNAASGMPPPMTLPNTDRSGVKPGRPRA